jgi:hypothetical protein
MREIREIHTAIDGQPVGNSPASSP